MEYSLDEETAIAIARNLESTGADLSAVVGLCRDVDSLYQYIQI